MCGGRRELPHHGSDWRRSNFTEARLRHDEGGPARRLSRMVARRRGRLRIRHQTRNEGQGLKLGQWELRSPGRVRVWESIVQAGAPLAWPMPDMRLPTKTGDWPSREERSMLRTSIGGEGKQRSRKVLPCNNGRTPTIRGEAPLIPSGQWLDENERVRQSCIPYLAGHLRVRQRCRDNALWEKRAFQWRHVRLPAADCQGSTRPIVTHGRGVLAARAKGLLLSTLLNGTPCQPPCFGRKRRRLLSRQRGETRADKKQRL